VRSLVPTTGLIDKAGTWHSRVVNTSSKMPFKKPQPPHKSGKKTP
jgi:hypothetical protein